MEDMRPSEIALSGLLIVTDCTQACGPLVATYDIRERGTRLQHGPDSEHTLLLEDRVMVKAGDYRKHCQAVIESWLRDIHEWERDPVGYMDRVLERQEGAEPQP